MIRLSYITMEGKTLCFPQNVLPQTRYIQPAGLLRFSSGTICGLLTEGRYQVTQQTRPYYEGIYKYPELLACMVVLSPGALALLNKAIENNHFFCQSLRRDLAKEQPPSAQSILSQSGNGKVIIKVFQDSKFLAIYTPEEKYMYEQAKEELKGTGLAAAIRFKLCGIITENIEDLTKAELAQVTSYIQENPQAVKVTTQRDKIIIKDRYDQTLSTISREDKELTVKRFLCLFGGKN